MTARVWKRLLLVALVLTGPPLRTLEVSRVLGQDLFSNITHLSFASVPPPLSPEQARDSFSDRASLVIDLVACKSEEQFARQLLEEHIGSEDITELLIGKIYRFYQFNPGIGTLPARESECRHTREYTMAEADMRSQLAALGFRPHGPDEPPGEGEIRCPDVTIHPLVDGKGRVEFNVTSDCLKQQINTALMRMEVTSQAGTELPCPSNIIDVVVDWDFDKFTAKGDWDMTLRNLVRILNMHPPRAQAVALEDETYDHIVKDLLTLDGGPVAETYSLFDCGNTTQHTGTPEERADDEEGADEFLSSLGNAGEYFAKRLLMLLLAVLIVVLAILAVVIPLAALGIIPLATALGVAVTAAVVTATVVINVIFGAETIGRFGETENHLWMMNTSAYLTNQILMRELQLAGRSMPDEFDNTRNGMREWILEHLQEILEEDFDEYNARPYQRLTITSIQNLYDYAEDTDIRRAAGMVLDYVAARFAAGSNQGRRVAPFRRLTGALEHMALFHTPNEADHSVFRALVNMGTTAELPNHEVDRSAAGSMIYAAVTSYRVPIDIIDLAINKSTPYLQRIHHDGVEIYASSPGFLLTAGGIRTSPALTVLGIFGNPEDAGAAVPTTLIPTSGVTMRSDLIHFDGAEDFDHNTCVYSGFACGLNPVIPPLYNDCSDTRAEAPGWTFINSARCNFGPRDIIPSLFGGTPIPPGNATSDPPYFYVAVFQAACPSDYPYCEGGRRYGFLEADDAPQAVLSNGDVDGSAFDSWISDVLARNPAVMSTVPGLPLTGTYVTTDGLTILFDASRGLKADDEWAILAVNNQVTTLDMDDWPLAEGPIRANDDAVVTISNPNRGTEIVLDMSDENNPFTVPAVIDR